MAFNGLYGFGLQKSRGKVGKGGIRSKKHQQLSLSLTAVVIAFWNVLGPFLRILGYFDWVCDPFIGITREQLLKQNTLAHILRLFLLLTATKLWITSSKHAGKISFPTQVVRKKGKKGQIQILRIIMYVLGYYTSHTGTKNQFWSKNPLDQKTPKKEEIFKKIWR